MVPVHRHISNKEQNITSVATYFSTHGQEAFNSEENSYVHSQMYQVDQHSGQEIAPFLDVEDDTEALIVYC